MADIPAALDESDLPVLQQARRLWGQSRWDEAEAAFVRIAEEHPRNLHALVDAARALGDRLQIRRARELLDKLSALAGDRADLFLLIGQTMRMCYREEEALALLRRYADGAGRRDPAGHLELAVLCERHHLLEEADAAATAALKVTPDCMEALIIRARVRSRKGEAGRAEAALSRVTSFAKTHLSTRAQAWCMRASIADRAGDFPAAVERLENAKTLLRPYSKEMLRNAWTVLGAWDKVCRALTPETAHRWMTEDSVSPFRKPVAHLLSFPRSGTTLLENILDAHPGIVSSEERQVLGRDLLNILWREPGEFTPPTVEAFDAILPEKLARLRGDYRDRIEEGLGEPVGGRVHIDKNPTHTLFIPGILRLLPDSRFLVALRDPRDVVVSCYFQFLPANPNSACFLTWEDTIRRYLLDMGAWFHLRTVLPRDRWLEVRYEDLVADLSGQARSVVDFLGLPWDDAVLGYRERVAEKVVHTPSYLAVREPVHNRAIGRWRKYEQWMQPHLELLRPLVEAFGYEW